MTDLQSRSFILFVTFKLPNKSKKSTDCIVQCLNLLWLVQNMYRNRKVKVTNTLGSLGDTLLAFVQLSKAIISSFYQWMAPTTTYETHRPSPTFPFMFLFSPSPNAPKKSPNL